MRSHRKVQKIKNQKVALKMMCHTNQKPDTTLNTVTTPPWRLIERSLDLSLQSLRRLNWISMRRDW